MSAIARRSFSALVPALLALPLIAAGCGDSNEGEGVSSSNKDTGSSSGVTEDGTIGDKDTSDAGSSSGGEDSSSSSGGVDSGSSSGGVDSGSSSGDTGTDAGTDAGTDTGEKDTDINPCPGGPGCDCKENTDCDGAVCLDTHEGKKCAKKCVDTCPSGYACKDIGSGSDSLLVCVSTQVSLCSPCKAHKDCNHNGIDSVCLDYGPAGQFCGSACKADSDCPADYECIDAKDGNGKDVKQCKKKFAATGGSGKACTADGDCDAKAGEACVAKKCQVGAFGACGCSEWAKKQGAETTCSLTNSFGTCSAARKCTAAGLSKCEAKTPAAEVCNGLDDDCNDKTPDGAEETDCSVIAFENKGSKTDCKTDADCTTKGEKCDVKGDKKCKLIIGECKGTATCVNGKIICTGAKTPTLEQCNLVDDNCDGTIDEGYLWENPVDGGKLKVGDACGVGPCKDGKVVCESFTKAICNTSDKAKPEKGACDGVDNDCNGKVDDLSCDDDDLCTKDACDSAKKTCSNEPAVDCDDKEQCTKDTCEPKTGKCKNAATDGASCDDKNACTEGDACGKHPKTGNISCLPGKPKACDDGNICTDNKCDTDKGCLPLPNAATKVCYSGAKGTENVGLCTAGVQACKDGKLDPKCVGETVPAKKEACDGKDDTCDGKTDEGCKPTDVAVTFSSAYVSGKSGTGDKAVNVQMMVGPAGPTGTAKGAKHQVDFGFLSWLMALLK